MLELLSPAGSMDAVRAAVQYGADAVYLGYGQFHARQGAKNFDKDELAQAIAYCHWYGVKVHITLNTLAHERETAAALRDAQWMNQVGADALIVQDLGLARQIRQAAPDLPLHASTQLTIHTVDGAKQAAALGFSRVVLARECTLEQIEQITREGGVETEVFVHGALCMCYSGQCYLSGMIGRRSGNRGQCAQPCRLPYRFAPGAKEGYPLSLKDLCLAGWLEQLRGIGVRSLKIEGRMKRPAYVAAATSVYAALLREQRPPTGEERALLERAFSREGFTDGYLTGRKGAAMFGVRQAMPAGQAQALVNELEQQFPLDKEKPRVPLDARFDAERLSGLQLTLSDGVHPPVVARDADMVEYAQNAPTRTAQVEKSLGRLGGTPYFLRDVRVHLEPGLRIPAARLNALRRQAVAMLDQQRQTPPPRRWNPPAPAAPAVQKRGFRGFAATVCTLEQARALQKAGVDTVYAPLLLAAQHPGLLPIVPRVFFDEEQAAIERLLLLCKAQGAHAALASNIGHLPLLRRCGLEIHGDFFLNACNGDCLDALAGCGVRRQALTIEAHMAQLRDIPKSIDTMVVAYGYLPLMIFENCAIRRGTGCPGPDRSPLACLPDTAGWTCQGPADQALYDRMGQRFPLLPAYGCRNELLNCQPLCLSDRGPDYRNVGAPYALLRFTTEPAGQCAAVLRAFQEGQRIPGDITRGLYYRGVK